MGLRDFVWSFQPVWFPSASKIAKDGELKEGERGCCRCGVFFSSLHSYSCRFHSLLSRTPWALTLTLLYHPWIINSHFWRALYGCESSGLSSLILESGKSRDPWEYHCPPHWPRRGKLCLTSARENLPEHTSSHRQSLTPRLFSCRCWF